MTTTVSAPNRPSEQRVGRAPLPRWQVWGWAIRITLLIAFLGAWQWYGSLGESFAIAPVTEVAAAFWDGIVSGDFLVAAGGTLLTMVLGYGIAVVVGVGFGVWIGISRYARNVFEPLVHAGYATPISLLIPIIGIYTGLDMQGRVILTALWCVFEILVSTVSGVRSVPIHLIEMGRSFGARRFKLYSSVILPAAFPLVIVGLRIGVGRAIRGAVTAELLLSAANLGAVILFAGSLFDVPRLLAAIIFVMAMGLVLMRLAGIVERNATQHLRVSETS
jgi:ABC-type nitrate/sulfonate/bicarbonate transport system permease component